MLVLGIETSCDETAASVVRDGKEILSNAVASQAVLHERFGGVVPELSCRRHVEVILPIIEQALQEAGVSLPEIDLIAVAKGPGLVGPLMIGINAAKALSFATGIPFIGVNHVEAHLYASLMSHSEEIVFPAIGAILSGGHTTLVLMKGVGEYQMIGQTIDDAVGEAFDKVAKILGLPYPGGPQIEALAKNGDRSRFSLKPGKVSAYDFSFSGLKTAVLYAAKGVGSNYHSPLVIGEEEQKDLAAAFQHVALEDIVKKIGAAAKEFECTSVLFGGGVTCNKYLKALFAEKCPGLTAFWPGTGLSLDNGAMIAGLGFAKWQIAQTPDSLALEASTSILF